MDGLADWEVLVKSANPLHNNERLQKILLNETKTSMHFILNKIASLPICLLVIVSLAGIGGALSPSRALAASTTKPDGAKVTEASSCKDYNGFAKTACSFGYNTSLGSKAANHLQPTKDYNSDEATDAAAECAKYKNAANLKACENGYKDGHYAYYHVSDTNPVALDGGRESAGNNAGCATSSCNDPAVKCEKKNCDLIKKYVNPLINVLTVVFGLIAVISLIIGGINYSTSEGDPQKVSRAKSRIFNTILAVVAYMFLYAFLEFLVPGGIFTM